MIAFLFFLATTALSSLAELKSLCSGMHGEKMAVSYEVLNTGKHVLIVKEKTGLVNNKAKFKQLHVIEVPIKQDESLSPCDGFKCRNKENVLLYAVVSKNAARKNASFRPVIAWFVDQKNMKLSPVDLNTELINCKWEPDGDSDYPYQN